MNRIIKNKKSRKYTNSSSLILASSSLISLLFITFSNSTYLKGKKKRKKEKTQDGHFQAWDAKGTYSCFFSSFFIFFLCFFFIQSSFLFELLFLFPNKISWNAFNIEVICIAVFTWFLEILLGLESNKINIYNNNRNHIIPCLLISFLS